MMPWGAIDAVAAVGVSLAAPVAAVVRRRIRNRALRRNADERCGSCGLHWTEIGVAPTEYRLHGFRICAPCASKVRRRTVAEVSALVVATGFASGAAYVACLSFAQWTPWWGIVWLASPPVLLAAATTAAIRRMKSDNEKTLLGSGPGSHGFPADHAPLSASRNERDVMDTHLESLLAT